VADTFVTEPQPDQNYGADLSMNVDKKDRSLLMFDLSSIPPGATVNSALLTLCLVVDPGGAAVGRTHELRRGTAPWTEMGVTWNTQPTVAPTFTTALTVPATAQCVSVDATADVQAWVDGAANCGWRITDQDEANAAPVTYGTRESALGLRPQLDVTYTP
jgi:hypothetical protein